MPPLYQILLHEIELERKASHWKNTLCFIFLSNWYIIITEAEKCHIKNIFYLVITRNFLAITTYVSRNYGKLSRNYEKLSRNYEKPSRNYEKLSRNYEKLSRNNEKLSRNYEKLIS